MQSIASIESLSARQWQGRNGQAVLLLHGLCANPLEMQPLARRFHQAGYTVRSPLIAGMGVDSLALREGARPGRCEQWIEEAATHLRELASTHEQVALAGLCIGAVLALALAAQADAARRVDALMLVSPTLYFDGWNVSPWRRLLPLAYLPGLRHRLSFAEKAPYGVKNERLSRWIGQAMSRDGLCAVGAAKLPAASLHQADRLIRRVKSSLQKVSAPTLVLHATEDDVASPRSVHLLQARLPSPPDVTWFHDSYHMLTLDNEREAVCASAMGFLSRHLPPRSDRPGAANDDLDLTTHNLEAL